ncbi:PH-domain-containing protein [Plenodomus tracheiphilus IPT5]|uniref:PH-domain-containing protein n=1 Tax=Plenodomus tracheiphilus IPT5 TaxID=1408161 RepID=A0A6A7B827_9PLEO|nr:PH-domain-containing protein [Plenodomus tracheiphilus IPT5]
MAATLAHGTPKPSHPIAISAPAMKLDAPAPPRFDTSKSPGASVGVMSPVNQNGCFEFDRIIKAGIVQKRTRKTRSWRPVYVVLRPNCLSIYKDKDETKLRHQINLAEITAVARQRDSKKKLDHVFGIFSPARNYHLGASTDKEAQEWVDLIRAEARMDGDEAEDFLPMTPATGKPFGSLGLGNSKRDLVSSSSEAEPVIPSSSKAPDTTSGARRPSQALNYSGNERASISDFDFSDTGFQASASSLPKKVIKPKRNVSQQSNIGSTPDDERVVYHGWLYVLKSKGGVRQWKKVWVVLRPKCLAFYKNEQEYSANVIIPMSSIIDAVDIDAVSRSKQYCMQVISEDKNFKFCAPDENSLARCLGAFKSLLAKKREGEQKRVVSASSVGGAGLATSVQGLNATATAATNMAPSAAAQQPLSIR